MIRKRRAAAVRPPMERITRFDFLNSSTHKTKTPLLMKLSSGADPTFTT